MTNQYPPRALDSNGIRVVVLVWIGAQSLVMARLAETGSGGDHTGALAGGRGLLACSFCSKLPICHTVFPCVHLEDVSTLSRCCHHGRPPVYPPVLFFIGSCPHSLVRLPLTISSCPEHRPDRRASPITDNRTTRHRLCRCCCPCVGTWMAGCQGPMHGKYSGP